MKSNQEGKGRQTMKLTIGVLGMVLALTSAGASMSAQTEATTDKASAATQETAPKTYRLTYAITHLEGAKQLGVQHFALTVIPDSRGYTDSQIRLGSRVPIATGGAERSRRLRAGAGSVSICRCRTEHFGPCEGVSNWRSGLFEGGAVQPGR